MAPRLKILMSSGSKATKRNPHILSFTLKNPSRRTASGSPEGTLWTEINVYRAFCVSLETLIKISLNKKALRKKRPSMFPKSEAPTEANAHFRALLNISFGVPSKGGLSQGSLHGIPRREMPRSWSPPSFIFQSPRYKRPPPHTRFPSVVKGPLLREMPRIRSLS